MNNRGLKSIVCALLIGIGANAIVAQLVGWFPMGFRPSEWKYVRAGDEACEVSSTKAFGRHTLTLRPLDRSWAAAWQGIREKWPRSEKSPSDPIYASDGEVPKWCSAWQPERYTQMVGVRTSATKVSASTCPPVDVGIGIPFISFSAALDARLLPSVTVNPPPVLHGGYMTDPLRTMSYDVRVVAWNPVWPGIIYGSLAWGAAFWCVLAALRFGRASKRRRKGQCLSCGYQRAGLRAESVCPECGKHPGA